LETKQIDTQGDGNAPNARIASALGWHVAAPLGNAVKHFESGKTGVS
jgi:hypothetical protein